MAALVAVVSNRNKKEPAASDTFESRYSVLPDEKDREFDIQLGMLMLNG
jgi:hypothetical protein